MFISPLEDLCVALAHVVITLINNRMLARYFVTELLGTDLHRLLTSRPLEKQFIQYFLYQILVRGHGVVRWLSANAPFSAVSNTYTRRASFIAISCVMKPSCLYDRLTPYAEAEQHSHKRELRLEGGYSTLRTYHSLTTCRSVISASHESKTRK